MKRIVILLTAIVMSGNVTELAAQSWGDRLMELLGGSSTTEESAPKSEPARRPETDEVRGEWIYQAPSIIYKGDDLLASLAVTGLKDQMAAYYTKAGLVPGIGSVTFGSRQRLEVRVEETRANGNYRYNPKTGVVAITVRHKERTLSVNGTLSLQGDALILEFEANDAIRALQVAAPELAQDEKMRQVAAIMQEYPGLMLGVVLKK